MVYPMEHVLVRFNGHFGTSSGIVDKWSSGIRFGLANQAPPYDATKLQTFVNACQAAGIAFHTAASVNAGTSTWFDQCTAAQIGVSGRYTPTDQLTIMSPFTPTSGLGSPSQAWNVASVISLRTSRPRGRGSNGRVYWPMTAASVVATTGRLNTQARVNAAATFINALNTAANAYFTGTRAIVASAVGGGLHVPVTSIRSDDRLDSIERRENDQSSVWYTAAIT